MAIKIPDIWWTAPAESENGKMVMVTGRDCVEKAKNSGKYNDRIEISWIYDGDDNGMPNIITSERMQEVTEVMQNAFKSDPIAIMTGIYTGDNRRDWILYTRNIGIFNGVLNKALSVFEELLPISIYAEKDADWSEYVEMRENTYISPEDD